MTNNDRIRFSIGARLLLGALVTAGAATAIAAPALAHAATYAYVTEAGQVQTVTADNADDAIMAAPDMAPHSGVLLVNSDADSQVVGDSISGT